MQYFTLFVALAASFLPFLSQAVPVSNSLVRRIIPGKYIIRFQPGTDVQTISSHFSTVQDIHARNLRRTGYPVGLSAGIEQEYDLGSFKGYAGTFDSSTIEELKSLPEVLSVEEDFEMTTFDLITEPNAPYHRASLSSRTKSAVNYLYDSSAGAGTFNYVVDTGVRITHEQFEGRAQWGHNAVDSIDTDGAGHGTHVAGTLAGKITGVAKKGTVIAVKVFSGNTGSASIVIAGFEWAVNDIVTKGRQNTAVINMSLGGPASTTWDAAITAAYEQGVLAVVAAGNANVDASRTSPCRSPETICVGNVQSDYSRLSGDGGSNYGSVVNIFAGGTDVVSAWFTADDAYEVLTGTSMSSPHVAGLVSYFRGLQGAKSAMAVKAQVLFLATPNLVTGTLGSANLLAYNGAGTFASSSSSIITSSSTSSVVLSSSTSVAPSTVSTTSAASSTITSSSASASFSSSSSIASETGSSSSLSASETASATSSAVSASGTSSAASSASASETGFSSTLPSASVSIFPTFTPPYGNSTIHTTMYAPHSLPTPEPSAVKVKSNYPVYSVTSASPSETPCSTEASSGYPAYTPSASTQLEFGYPVYTPPSVSSTKIVPGYPLYTPSPSSTKAESGYPVYTPPSASSTKVESGYPVYTPPSATSTEAISGYPVASYISSYFAASTSATIVSFYPIVTPPAGGYTPGVTTLATAYKPTSTRASKPTATGITYLVVIAQPKGDDSSCLA